VVLHVALDGRDFVALVLTADAALTISSRLCGCVVEQRRADR
jgi:hypothetical protein